MTASVLLLLASVRPAAAQGAWIEGQILTNYGSSFDGKSPWQPSYGTLEGSCGFGLLDKSEWPYWSAAALSTRSPFYIAGPLRGCGQCFEVQCVDNVAGSPFEGRCNANSANNSVIVTITDSCPECEANHMDMQALTFARLAPLSQGRVDMRYRPVDCAPPTSMQLNVVNGQSGSGFFKFTVMGVGGSGALQGVQVRGSAPANGRAAAEWVEAVPVVEAKPATPLSAAITSVKSVFGRRLLAAKPTKKRPTKKRPTKKRPTKKRPTKKRPTKKRPTNKRPTSSLRTKPTRRPTKQPTAQPTTQPTAQPTAQPTPMPVQSVEVPSPTTAPTLAPTPAPTPMPVSDFAGTPLQSQYGAAWQMNQMPKLPLSFRFIGPSSVVTAENVVTAQQLAMTPILPTSAQFDPSSGSVRTGSQAIGSARYGSSNPTCPVGQFYDMTVGSVPACKACVGFSWNMDAALQCYPPLQSTTQKFFCAPLSVSAVPLDVSASAACLDPAATTHTVLIKQQASSPIAYALADVQPNVVLRANSQTILTASSVTVTADGVVATFSDPSQQVGALMANRKNRSDMMYVEGSIKVGGTGSPICFSSNQALGFKMCAASG